jgi:NitT/TauT family transport system substrate-binding protein
MKRVKFALRALALSGALSGFIQTASAEVDTIKVARQYGIGYLPLIVVEHDKLIEKYAAEAGLGNVKVEWVTFAGSSVMNDALLSGTLDFATVGPPSLVTFWAKTAGTPQEIEGVNSVASAPLYLNTRNPDVKSVRDFSGNDRIALPAVKVSIQAIVLEMAAEQAFGKDNYTKLDSLTVSRSHPDAMAELLSGTDEINSHFTWPPYSNREQKDPRVHIVLSSFDVLGGPASAIVTIGTKRFHDANPKLFRAFFKAMNVAMVSINQDKRRAAEIYLEVTKERTPLDEITQMISAPDMHFTTVPERLMKFADFMYQVGTVKKKPTSWKEMFFPEAQAMPGS